VRGREWHRRAQVPADHRRPGQRPGAEAVAHGVDRAIQTGAGQLVERQRQLDGAVVVEIAHRHADERDALLLDQRAGGGQQPARGVQDRGRVRRRLRQRVRPRGPGAVVMEAQPHRHRVADPAGRAQPAGHPVDQGGEDRLEFGMGARPPPDRGLRAHRAAPPADLDPARIPADRQRVDVPAGRHAEHRHEGRLAQPGHPPDRHDSALAELAGGDRPDAPQLLDRQRVEKLEFAVGRHEQQPVGLRDAAGDLREELGAGHPDRDGQPDPLAHLAAQPRGDLDGRAVDPPQPADVEERLVDG
jgi:hypothetical protein